MLPEIQDKIADLSMKIPNVKHLHPKHKRDQLMQGLVDLDIKHGYRPNSVTLPHRSDEYGNDIILLLESVLGNTDLKILK